MNKLNFRITLPLTTFKEGNISIERLEVKEDAEFVSLSLRHEYKQAPILTLEFMQSLVGKSKSWYVIYLRNPIPQDVLDDAVKYKETNRWIKDGSWFDKVSLPKSIDGCPRIHSLLARIGSYDSNPEKEDVAAYLVLDEESLKKVINSYDCIVKDIAMTSRADMDRVIADYRLEESTPRAYDRSYCGGARYTPGGNYVGRIGLGKEV